MQETDHGTGKHRRAIKMMRGKLPERGRSSAPLLLDGLILRSLQGIMQQLLVVGRIACLMQKDCRYDEAGHPECG